MRCSSCEILLDRYVEGTLPARQMAAIGAHLERCPACSAMLAEVRVIDALLATTKSPELAHNFTFAVMAEVRTMRIAPKPALSVWAVLSFYLIAAWVAVSAIAVASGGRVAWLGAAIGSARTSFAEALATVAGASHGVGPAAPLVFSVVAAVLALDVALAVTLLTFHRTIRPRLAARLARSESS